MIGGACNSDFVGVMKEQKGCVAFREADLGYGVRGCARVKLRWWSPEDEVTGPEDEAALKMRWP